MAENKAPAYQWYPRDFEADEPVKLMTLEAEGAYRRLLDHQWLHGSIPSEIREIAQLCKNTPVARMKRLWLAIAPCFRSVDGDETRLQNAKLERIRAESEEYRKKQSAKGKAGAQARWGTQPEDSPEDGTGSDHEHGTGNDSGHASAIEQAMPADGSAPAPAPASAGNTNNNNDDAGDYIALREEVAHKLSSEYRPDLDRFVHLIRPTRVSTASSRRRSWMLTLLQILDPQYHQHYGPDVVGLAIRDTIANGTDPNVAFFRGMCRKHAESLKADKPSAQPPQRGGRPVQLFTRDHEAEGAALWGTILGGITSELVQDGSSNYHVKKLRDDVVKSLSREALAALKAVGGERAVATASEDKRSFMGTTFAKAYAGAKISQQAGTA